MNVQTPDRETEERDQHDFDEAVDHTGKMVLEWLAGAGIVAALLISIVALIQSGQKSEPRAVTQPAATHGVPVAPAATGPVRTESLKIVGGSKLGPDGKKHDEFTKTEFAVKVGQPLKLLFEPATIPGGKFSRRRNIAPARDGDPGDAIGQQP